MLIDLIVSPAKAGPLDIHIYTLSPAGGNLFTPGITAEMSLPSKGIAPISVPLVRAGPNHFLACHRATHTRRQHGGVQPQVRGPVRRGSGSS